MELLKQRIINDGKYLGDGILKVDSFMNHQIDPALMKKIGEALAGEFKELRPSRILTAESSGIAPSLVTAIELGIPVVYARKNQPITMKADPFREKSESHTHKKSVELIVSTEYLDKNDRVLIIDDFLATARTILALVKVVEQSGATLIGIASVIEKEFEGGRERVSHLNVPVLSLARIKSFEGDKVNFAE